jgi:hypothetical protein
MDPSTMHLAATIHRERLAEAEQARQWALRSVTTPLRQRLLQALSLRLIRWGEQLRVPTPSVQVRP